METHFQTPNVGMQVGQASCTGKSELCPGRSGTGVGRSYNWDTQVPFISVVPCQCQRYLYALYNPLSVCSANNLWGWSKPERGVNTKPWLCYRNGSVGCHLPCCPEAGIFLLNKPWPLSMWLQVQLGHGEFRAFLRCWVFHQLAG